MEVSSESEFRDVLSSSSSGDTVVVDSSVVIDGDDRFVVPSGVTIESDGATITFTQSLFDDDVPTFRDGSAIDGFRIYGPNDFPTDSEYSDASSDALNISGNGVIVGNCEVAGFGHRAIRVTGDGVLIHNCHIHDVAGDGYGYGIGFEGGAQDGLIEYCRFAFNRHSIATNGECTWEARYNWVSERHDTGNHAFDCHEQGSYISVHHNTFAHNGSSSPGEALRIRGGGSSDITFTNNWVWNLDDCGVVSSDESCVISDDQGAGNWEITNNHYGTSQPPSDVGVAKSETGIGSTSSRDSFELVDIWSTVGTAQSGPYDVSVTVDGEIEFGPEAEPDDDTIVDNGDGTMTFTSHTLGNRGSDGGPADNYYIKGVVTDITVTESS